MTLFVDFNLEDDRGRIPALVPQESVHDLWIGAIVVAADDEGNSCKAYVADFDKDSAVAFLAVDTSTWTISEVAPSIEAV